MEDTEFSAGWFRMGSGEEEKRAREKRRGQWRGKEGQKEARQDGRKGEPLKLYLSHLTQIASGTCI